MERKVGEIFEYNGEWYQCIEHNGCIGCVLRRGQCKLFGNCSITERNDGIPVIFKKLEKVGEPIRIENKSYQKIKVPDAVCNNCAFYSHFSRDCKLNYYVDLNPVHSCFSDEMFVEIKENKEDMKEKKLTYEELEHYYDSTCGLWAIDRDPKQVTLEWIVENVFQLGDTIPEKVCASNLKPFDLEAAKAGKPVCTRDGRKARIICWDKKGNYPIVALIQDNENSEHIEYYTENGIFSNGGNEKNRDLMMLPEKKEGWVNVYKSDNNKYSALLGSAYVYKTKAEAELNFDKDNGLAIVKIEWEE